MPDMPSLTDFLPHRPPLLLLDSIVSVDDREAVCRAVVGRGHALEPFLDVDGSLRACFAIELMAQTVGVWSGNMRRKLGLEPIAVGFLLGARAIDCSCGSFAPGAELEISMRIIVRDERAGAFEGEIRSGGRVLCTGRINTFHTDSAGELDGIFSL